jgi:hypothetical protein
MGSKSVFYYRRCLFFGLIFLSIVIFFTTAHPLVPYDGDDWLNLASLRKAVPMTGAYNPIKVLPETLFPLSGLVAAYVVYPLVGDYISAISLTSALIMGGIVCLYMYLFFKLVEHWLSLSDYANMMVTALFFLFHFALFYEKSSPVPYLFGSGNLTCIYHYVIPALVNLCVVLYLARFDIAHEALNLTPGRRSVLLFCIYLAIFSNALSNIILAAYVSCLLGFRFFAYLKEHGGYKAFVKENAFYIGIIVVWLIALVFESHGGRAHDIGKGITFSVIYETGKIFLSMIGRISVDVVVVGVLSIAAALYSRYRKKDQAYDSILGMYLGTSLVSALYLLFVCAKAGPGYIGRSDVFISFIIWTVLLMALSLAYALKNNGKGIFLVPFLVLFFAVEAGIGPRGYAESTVGQVPPSICYEIDYNLIEQIQAADREGKTEMILRVPKGDTASNWPHPAYMGGKISQTLYKHGLISRNIKIKIQPDAAMNEQYHIAVPK